MNLEQGDIVLCTVDRIVGTTVFVHIEGNGEGSIVFSEVAPGRIRNIRDYVVAKKKIVCKVLRISGDRIDLSLRRVTQKEQKEVKEFYKVGKNYENILKSILGSSAPKAMKEMSKEGIQNFLQAAKNTQEGLKALEKIVGKEKTKKIIDILKTQQKKKKTILKKEILLTAPVENGIVIIKELLGKIRDTDIRYIAAGRYSLRKETDDIKKADQQLALTLSDMEKEARKKGAEFSILKK